MQQNQRQNCILGLLFTDPDSNPGIMSDSDDKMLIILQQVSKSHLLSVQLHNIECCESS